MIFTGISYLAVLVAAVVGWLVGAVWYGLLFGRQWIEAVGMKEPPRPMPSPFIIAFVADLVIAYMLAGVVGHLGEVVVWRALVTAFFVWIGFVATTLVVNHRFERRPLALTLIDGGHWLAVLLAMGLVVGLFGA